MPGIGRRRYAAISVLTDWILQLTFFVGCFALIERRITAKRYDLLCCLGPRKLVVQDSASELPAAPDTKNVPAKGAIAAADGDASREGNELVRTLSGVVLALTHAGPLSFARSLQHSALAACHSS